MPNKTLSVREEDLPLWERAERAAKHDRTSVSALVASALADRLGATDTCRVIVWKSPEPSRTEVFEGRWLTQEPHLKDNWDGGVDNPWSTYVAETKRGRIAVYARQEYLQYDAPTIFEVFDNLDSATRAFAGNPHVDQDVLSNASYALGRNGRGGEEGRRGEEIRWRDI